MPLSTPNAGPAATRVRCRRCDHAHRLRDRTQRHDGQTDCPGCDRAVGFQFE